MKETGAFAAENIRRKRTEEFIVIKEITATGKTVEEAYAKAREELGVDSLDGMICTILDIGKKGLFGLGGTPAKVKVEYRDEPQDAALGFVKTLLANMNIEASVEVTETEENGKLINISGNDAGILIGHHGDTLDALQYLTSLAANKHSDTEESKRVKVTVDIENYRAKREKTLRTLANRMAEKALKYRRSVMLEPMNPYERRIIHSEIQNIEGVSTNSVGSENNRKIVIYLTDKAEDKKPYVKGSQGRGAKPRYRDTKPAVKNESQTADLYEGE